MASKVFLSYSHADVETADALVSALKKKGIDVWRDRDQISFGANIIETIRAGISEADAVLALVSSAYTASSWAQEEIATWRLLQVNTGRPLILPVITEDVNLPSSLAEYSYLDLRVTPIDQVAEEVARAVKPAKTSAAQHKRQKALSEARPDTSARHIDRLRTEFARGNLTLFCGAGVSMGAGIPGWSVLVKALLTSLFNKDASEAFASRDAGALAEIYQTGFGMSPLIIAQYLKNGLGREFKDAVRHALYAGNPTTSALIDAIVELCRPQRERKELHSIVTFNFDDLIEHNLQKAKVRYRSIFAEGQRCLSSEIPIYHVHGFLPRDGSAQQSSDLVFSEDAYHSQFIDAFSWSNLVQLNHLGQTTCLFVGLSMTDPNLRRLLDVSMRKNPDKSLNHFLLRRRYQETDVAMNFKNSNLKGQEQGYARKLVRMAEVLEEQDANNLGLNVIWVDEYEDMPRLLTSVVEAAG
jgi:hypothetical protein